MDKYEYKLKTEQMLELMENGAYNRAAEIADTIDWKRVRNATMLTNVSDIYEKNGDYQKSYEVLNIAYHRAEGSRKVLYRLCSLALKTGNVDEAIDYYDDFMQVAPKDPNQHILRYKILSARRAPVEQRIEALEEFKKAEYIEEWAYELAKLYQEAGMTAECLEECDDLILWFSEGKFVFKAMELKMQYKPLTPSQQDKYDHRYEKLESETEEIPDLTQYQIQKAALLGADLDNEEDRELEESSFEEEQEVDELPEKASKELEEESDAVEEIDEPESIEEDETIQKLTQKGIASTMKLQDALKSLLHPEGAESRADEADDEMQEEVPELEAAIEEIESVIDLELVNELTGKTEKERIRFDSDLEELKAEPLEEELGEGLTEEGEKPEEEVESELGDGTENLEDIPDEDLEQVEDFVSIPDELLEEAGDFEDISEEEIDDCVTEEDFILDGEEELENYEEEELLEETETVGIEEAETAENIKSESKKTAEDQIQGQLSIEDILMGWGDKPEEEVDMEEKKKKAEPILPPDIQRMIDEIEGVLPEETEPEPVRPARRAADEPRENMGQITQQFRIDDLDEFLAAEEEHEDGLDSFIDDLPEEIDEYDDGLDEVFEDDINLDEDEEYTDEYEDDLEEYQESDSEDYEEEYEESDVEEYEEEYEESDVEEYEEEYEESDAEDYEEEYEESDVEDYEEEYEESDAEEYEEEYEESDAEDYEDEYDSDYQDEYQDEDYEVVDEYEEDDDYGDIEASFEEEFRPNPEHISELDDREIPDEEEMDILSATTPLSRKETAKLIATGKTAPLPLDEISDALSMSDTGFIVHGRYDLEAQSGIGTRAGLTEEQKKLFSYFVPVRGMSEQLVDVLEQDSNCTNRNNTSRTGNLLIIGNKGNGKTVLAVDVVKAIQKQRNIRQGKVAIVTGDSLNKKKISDIFAKLYGGALIIEKAAKMNEKTVARLNKAMERDTGEMLIVLEEQRKPLDRLLSSNREFRRKFTSRLEVPIFINDELVTFGQTYAQENGYRIDEMGILALYSRIDALQREDHAVTVAEVKEVMDEAMEHSQKASAKKLVKRVFGKNTDDADRIILSEKDFNI